MGKPVLVVGGGELAAELVAEVGRRGVRCVQVPRPGDRELASALRAGPRFVAVISHDDIEALRLALVAEHARPGVPLLVTIFDRTVATQLLRVVPNCHVVSLADAAAPVLAEDCLGKDARTPSRTRRTLNAASAQLRPFDASS